MRDYTLSKEKTAELKQLHRSLRDKRQADRVKAVIALSEGWSAAEVAKILLFDEKTSRVYFDRYQQGGIDGGQFTVPDPDAGIDVEEVVEKPPVTVAVCPNNRFEKNKILSINGRNFPVNFRLPFFMLFDHCGISRYDEIDTK